MKGEYVIIALCAVLYAAVFVACLRLRKAIGRKEARVCAACAWGVAIAGMLAVMAIYEGGSVSGACLAGGGTIAACGAILISGFRQARGARK